MLPDQEELKKQFSKKSTEELLSILRHSKNYRKEAIEIIENELTTRGANENDVKQFLRKELIDQQFKINNSTVELEFYQKIMVFFLWIVPFFISAYEMNWKEDGMILKVKQSQYYKISGITSMFVSVIAGILIKANYISVILISFFFISLLIEKYLVNFTKSM